MTLALGVLVSGRGSNLGAILEAIGSGQLDAQVRLVVSNRAGVPALARAEAAGAKTLVVAHETFPDRERFERALVAVLRDAGADWIVLAGFMRILSRTFLEAFPGRVVNIHPSLLPAFPGLDAQGQALAAGVTRTGCTVHLVDEGLDTGPVLAQAEVPVFPDDTRDTLAARILAAEHRLLVATLVGRSHDR